MSPLFTDEERLQMMRDHEQLLAADRQRQREFLYPAQQPPKPKTKAEILVEVAHEFAPCTVAELADASGMSASWVRRHLHAAGVTLQKPVRRKKGQP
jgi:hypothetical protein